MVNRPTLSKDLNSKAFREYYFLKEELVDFCKENGLQITGSKSELAERIATYLDTGEKYTTHNNKKKNVKIDNITLDTLIEENFVCSEKHRSFYKEHIGNNFSFNVTFQKWLKSNPGKSYKDSINAYYLILEEKKSNNKKVIDKQFEYNTYIRDFFEDNKGLSLNDAIKCWNYKKMNRGSHKYEKDDLKALKSL